MRKDFNIRVIYIVPSDVEPWQDAEQSATQWLEDAQWFFADEMKRLGYDPKTFEIARDDTGYPVFDQIICNLSKKSFDAEPWKCCKSIADKHQLRNTNDIVVYFFEYYSFPVGQIPNASSRGAQRGFGGEAFISSLHLKLARREWVADENGYDGEKFDWIRTEPMDSKTLSWNGRGRQLGDVSGAAYGIMTHELGHAFGLHHDRNNDQNRKGNLMGNGCRGMRGYYRSDLTDDFCVLTAEDASILDKSNYFSARDLKERSIIFGS